MKAVICTRYGPPEVLQLTEVDKPAPKDNEVLIKVRATTVTVADSRVRGFRVPPAAWLPARLFLGITKPKRSILGVELSGEIESVGKDVTRFKAGDEVYASTLALFGAHAEYTCLPETHAIERKPVNLTFEEAAAIPVGARTALRYLQLGNIQPGQKVLVYGASGSVGTYAVQLAKYYGAEVTGVCSRSNLDMVRSLGADKVLDYTDKTFTRQLEQYDVIFIAVDKWPFSHCNKFLKDGGTYMNITAPMKNLPMWWTSMTSKKKFIMGHTPGESAQLLRPLKEIIEAGHLKPAIDRIYPLEQIAEAHRYVDKGHKKGNVVITLD